MTARELAMMNNGIKDESGFYKVNVNGKEFYVESACWLEHMASGNAFWIRIQEKDLPAFGIKTELTVEEKITEVFKKHGFVGKELKQKSIGHDGQRANDYARLSWCIEDGFVHISCGGFRCVVLPKDPQRVDVLLTELLKYRG